MRPFFESTNISFLLQALTAQLGRDPTTEELAENLGVTTQRLSNVLGGGRPPASLDAQMNSGEVGDDNEDTLADSVAAPDTYQEEHTEGQRQRWAHFLPSLEHAGLPALPAAAYIEAQRVESMLPACDGSTGG